MPCDRHMTGRLKYHSTYGTTPAVAVHCRISSQCFGPVQQNINMVWCFVMDVSSQSIRDKKWCHGCHGHIDIKWREQIDRNWRTPSYSVVIESRCTYVCPHWKKIVLEKQIYSIVKKVFEIWLISHYLWSDNLQKQKFPSVRGQLNVFHDKIFSSTKNYLTDWWFYKKNLRKNKIGS